MSRQKNAFDGAFRQVRALGLAAVLAVGASGCLSSGPPAPPVRWFDPVAASMTDGESAGLVTTSHRVHVVAAAHLRSEFAVRVGEHEVAFDDDHRWLEPPAELVALALRRVGIGRSVARDAAIVQLERFEFDRTAQPRAHVRMVVQRHEPGLPDGVVDVAVMAGDDSPTALVAAMAAALMQAVTRVPALLAADG